MGEPNTFRPHARGRRVTHPVVMRSHAVPMMLDESRLVQLAEPKDQGVLTEDELAAQKTMALGS